MAIREGAWDCPTCGQKGLRGSSKYCGSCGTVRGDEVEFYLPEGAREVTEAEELRRAQSGPDWKCPYCGGDNPGFHHHCSGCGSPQDGTEKRATRLHLQDTAAASPQTSSGWGRRLLTGCSLLLLLFFASCWWLTRTTTQALQVESMAWQRSLEVETFGWVQGEGWEGRGEVPAQARILSKSRQIREHRKVQTGTVSKTRTRTEQVQTGTRQVKVGTKDLGNGFFEDVYRDEPVYEQRQVEERYEDPVYREEPVYDQKVRYEVERWHTERTLTSQGTDNSPQWPVFEPGPQRREGPRKESYTLTLSGEGKRLTYEPATEEEFRRYTPGQKVTAEVTVTGLVKSLSPGT